MSIAALSIDLDVRLAKFEGDMGKAARLTQKSADEMARSLRAVTGGIAALGAGISVAGIVAFTREAINSIDALNDLSDATGASIENISALEDVAARTGTSFDTVQTSLIKLNKVLSDAKPGSDAEAALTAIGLSAKELKALDPAEALLKTAQALAGFADDGNKARIVQELFGKSLKEVAPLLKDLAEQGQLNATVTTAQAQAAEKFNKQLFGLQKNITDASRGMVSELVPALADGAERFALAYKHAGSFLGVLGMYARIDADKGFAGNLEKVNQDIAALEERATRITSASVKLGNDRAIAQLRAQADYIKELQRTKALADQGDTSDAVSRKYQLGRKTLGDLPEKAPRKAAGAGVKTDPDADFVRYLDNLQKQVEKTQELGVYEQLLADIQAKRLTVDSAQQQRLETLAKELDLKKEIRLEEAGYAEQEKLNQKTRVEIDADRANKLKSLLDATPSAALEKQREDMLLLAEEFEKGRLSEENYYEAVNARLGLTAEKTKEAKGLAEDLGLSFSSAFEDAIVGGKGLGDVLKGLEQDILRIVTRKLVTEPAGDALSGLLKGVVGGGSGGGEGGLADLFKSFMNFEGGGFTGAGSRSGGLDGKGGFMAMLHPNESVLDHTKGQGLGGGSVNIVQNIRIDSRSDQATIMAAMSQAKEMAKAEIMRSRQRGGVFA